MKQLSALKGVKAVIVLCFTLFISVSSFTSSSPFTSFHDQAPLSVHAAAFLDPEDETPNALASRLMVEIELPAGVPQAARSAITVETRALTSRGVVAATHTDTFDVSKGPADLVTSVIVPRARYQVQATLRAGDFTATGSAAVDIPDFTWAVLSMSDVVFSSDSRAVMVAEAARGVVPVAPVARLEFPAGDRVSVFARLYAGRSMLISPVTLTATIGRTGQRPVFTDSTPATPMRPNPLRTADYRLWLPLDQLGAGDWTLTLRARSQDRHTATRQVVFNVR